MVCVQFAFDLTDKLQFIPMSYISIISFNNSPPPPQLTEHSGRLQGGVLLAEAEHG